VQSEKRSVRRTPKQCRRKESESPHETVKDLAASCVSLYTAGCAASCAARRNAVPLKKWSLHRIELRPTGSIAQRRALLVLPKRLFITSQIATIFHDLKSSENRLRVASPAAKRKKGMRRRRRSE
jgi:hypothetical protein